MASIPQSSAIEVLRPIINELASYQTSAQLRRSAEREYGCSYEEVLEMAYENMLQTAKLAKKKLPRRS